MPPPPPPPGPPGGGPVGPGGLYGGHPPPPQAAQPYYIYYPLQQHHEEGVRLKDPDVFTGKDPTKLPSFITQCTHWFMAKPRKFPNERDKVLFAASYLRDLANQWWMPLLTQVPPPPLLDDWATFSDELFQMFSNQHLQTTSQNAILDMKMKEEGRVSEYLVRFNSHAVYTGWNDSAVANHFYRGLPRRIKERFAYMRRPQTFVEMRRCALGFDQNYWEYQEELGHKPRTDSPDEQSSGRNRRNRTNHPPASQTQNHQSSGKAPNPTSDKRQTPTPKPSGQKWGSANATTQLVPRGPLSQKEKDDRRAKGLCLYCGEGGHAIADCKRLPSNRHHVTGRATYSFASDEHHVHSDSCRPRAIRSGPALPAAEGDSDSAGNSSPA
jgi:hypothetical protein